MRLEAWRCICDRRRSRPFAFLRRICWIEFEEGETIWTESSHKYSAEEVFEMAKNAGFRCEAQWIDEQWPFAESLLVAE